MKMDTRSSRQPIERPTSRRSALASVKTQPGHPHDARPLVAESGARQRIRGRRPDIGFRLSGDGGLVPGARRPGGRKRS